MLNKYILLKIRKLAFQIDWDKAFGGKSKGNQHLFRITEIAKFLAKQTKANLSIVEAGALLHDTALAGGDESNYQKNKQVIEEILKEFNLTKPESDKITECVVCHEGAIKPRSLEAKIVHDADILEKSGLLGIIRHTWKVTNLGKIKNGCIDNNTVREILQHIQWRNKRLQIPFSRTISNYLDVKMQFKEAKELIQKISGLARQGIITEKIAQLISKNLTQQQAEKLKQQLDLTYLELFV